jgi:hypothetical protein
MRQPQFIAGLGSAVAAAAIGAAEICSTHLPR